MERKFPPVACSIAGSDSGGGAGIQADIKTFQALGVWGLTVISAITAQNTRQVRGFETAGPGCVSLQLATLLEEFEIRAIKTGMLGDAETIRAVSAEIPRDIPLVLDPVMVSTSGHRLYAGDAVQEMMRCLIPRAAVVTPNIPEAEVLSGIGPIDTLEKAREAGRRILGTGPEYVLVKGGHLPGDEATDLLLGADQEWIISTRRYPYSVHGAGCCYSAALCAFLAHGYPVPDAFGRAKKYMGRLLDTAIRGPSGIYLLHPVLGGHQE